MFSKPALVYTSILMVAVILTGFFVYSNYQVDNLNHVVMEAEIEKEVNLASLENLKESLSKMELSLASLKEKDNKQEALVMAEIVKSTAKEGERVVENLRNSEESLSTEVLATLDGLDNQAKDIEAASIDIQKDILKDCIAFLETRSLTEEDQARLEKAKEFYESGKEEQAMLLITKINNN
jgi:preprotein translocase subunit SecF